MCVYACLSGFVRATTQGCREAFSGLVRRLCYFSEPIYIFRPFRNCFFSFSLNYYLDSFTLL